MYEFQCLGTGDAFCLSGNYQSNFLITCPEGKRLLLDCGSDARRSLFDLDYTAKDIDAVYISHLHSDHIGGLEWLAFSTYFNPSLSRPELYLHESLRSPLWEHSLQGGMRSVFEKSVSLDDYFSVTSLSTKETWHWQGLEIKLVFSYHVQDNGVECPCYGLMIQSPDTLVYFTADLRFCPEYCDPFYQQADLIFHDAETMAVKSGVHTHYSELKTLPASYRKKMMLYHYNDINVINTEEDGFKGVLTPSLKLSF